MKLQISVRCPLCGHTETYGIAAGVQPNIVLCDSEEGGCDEWFAVQIEIKTVTVVKTAVIGQMSEVGQ